MKYTGITQFNHQQAPKIGVLITNLGTPEAPTPQALKPYLKQFLWDPRVVEVPRPLWWLILNGIILNIRPKKSAKAYESVWTEQGSPLAFYTQNQAAKVRRVLTKQWGDQIEVEWAMRYGEPSISHALQKLQDKNVQKLVVLPLYPQYCAATTASTFDAIAEDFKQRRWIPELRFINQYADHTKYIDAIANSIQEYWDRRGKAPKLIFSYHGVPLKYLHKGDPYHCYCLKTSRLVAEKLNLSEDEYLTSFQSRFGREQWLQPYTDETLKSLAAEGLEHVQIICPGFAADCLETIEEIGEENRDYFFEAGGKRYEYIPALNDQDEHIEFLTSLINTNLHGWNVESDPVASDKRAKQCPYNHKQP